MTQISPQEQCELCSIDLQTGNGEPKEYCWHSDHLGFLEAVPGLVFASESQT